MFHAFNQPFFVTKIAASIPAFCGQFAPQPAKVVECNTFSIIIENSSKITFVFKKQGKVKRFAVLFSAGLPISGLPAVGNSPFEKVEMTVKFRISIYTDRGKREKKDGRQRGETEKTL